MILYWLCLHVPIGWCVGLYHSHLNSTTLFRGSPIYSNSSISIITLYQSFSLTSIALGTNPIVIYFFCLLPHSAVWNLNPLTWYMGFKVSMIGYGYGNLLFQKKFASWFASSCTKPCQLTNFEHSKDSQQMRFVVVVIDT